MPTGTRYLQEKMTVLLNLRIALKLYDEHATPSTGPVAQQRMSGGVFKSYLPMWTNRSTNAWYEIQFVFDRWSIVSIVDFIALLQKVTHNHATTTTTTTMADEDIKVAIRVRKKIGRYNYKPIEFAKFTEHMKMRGRYFTKLNR